MCARLLERVRRLVSTAIHVVRGHLLRLTGPATTTSQVLGVAADLVRSRYELVDENALLRQQLIILLRTRRRPRLSRVDRPPLVCRRGPWTTVPARRQVAADEADAGWRHAEGASDFGPRRPL